MPNFAFNLPVQQQQQRIVAAQDLHWIKWSFSLDKWCFPLRSKWFENTLLAFFCSVICAYSRQNQQIDGLDVPLKWLLERCFGPSLSLSSLKRALNALKEAGFLVLPRKRPGPQGKRIIFSPTLCDIALQRSARPSSGSDKDRRISETKSFNKEPERARVNIDPVPAKKLERIDPVVKSVMVTAKKLGIEEGRRKRLFRLCMIELARLGTGSEWRNSVDWEYYRPKWLSMTWGEREGLAALDILPLILPSETKKQESRKPDIIENLPDEKPGEIRAKILKSLGMKEGV